MKESDIEIQKTIAALNEQTKLGHRIEVLAALKKINKNQINLEALVEFADLALRNNDFNLSLKFLYSQMRENTDEIIYHEKLLTTYATALIGVGANAEAKTILQKIKNNPATLLSHAFLLFSEWDYTSSIPLIVKYMKQQTDPYKKIVGQINLVAAYIGSGEMNKGEQELTLMRKELASFPEAKILLGNSWEIQSQLDIYRGNYTQALESLQTSANILGDNLNRYLLYVNKWKAVANLSINPKQPKAIENLQKIKQQAFQIRNWETVRDCDFHLARLTNNESLLSRILCGTPYRGYRSRIDKLYNLKIKSDKSFIYCPMAQDLESKTIDLDLQELPKSIQNKSTTKSLLKILTSDIYKPPRVGVVFHALYPEEYFNPFTSPSRVRNSILRFNAQMNDVNKAFQIKIIKGDVLLFSKNFKSIKVPIHSNTKNQSFELIINFRKTWGGGYFKTSDFSKFHSISKVSALKLINFFLEKKWLIRTDQGKSTYYRFKKK